MQFPMMHEASANFHFNGTGKCKNGIYLGFYYRLSNLFIYVFILYICVCAACSIIQMRELTVHNMDTLMASVGYKVRYNQ